MERVGLFPMRAASLSPRLVGAAPLRSKRMLSLASDERLVEQIRRGNEAAFEVAFERHVPAILGFCRHMLGSVEEAEDAVQQTFASAHGALQRDQRREIALRPWLFAIARNRCLSMLRVRREQPVEAVELPAVALTDEVERRAELRQLLADVRELPEEQRAALLLTELGALSHVEVAHVLECEVPRVKGLVYRARSRLIELRAARETPCEQIREQLANLRGGSLRRTELRLHLRECPGCRLYREQVAEQRQLLAAALPVAPTVGLKASVLAAAGLGGGSAGGGAAAGLASAAGLFGGPFGNGALAKLAVVGVLAGGGAVAGDAVMRGGGGGSPAAPAAVAPAAGGELGAPPGQTTGGATVRRMQSESPLGGAGRERSAAGRARRANGEHTTSRSGSPGMGARSRGPGGRFRGPGSHSRGPKLEAPNGRGRAVAKDGAPGLERKASGLPHRAAPPHRTGKGRGPIDAPPAHPPVRRGPPASTPNPPQPKHAPRSASSAPAPAPLSVPGVPGPLPPADGKSKR
jgi:RNA polymerase sigma factor (sigma-70 family)